MVPEIRGGERVRALQIFSHVRVLRDSRIKRCGPDSVPRRAKRLGWPRIAPEGVVNAHGARQISSVGPMAFKIDYLTLKAIKMVFVLTYKSSRQPVEITPSGSGNGFLGVSRRGSQHWARPDSHGYRTLVYPLCMSAQAAPQELRDEVCPC